MIYTIDDESVNDRPDWTHRTQPTPAQGTREEMFPGLGARYLITGPGLPPEIVVEGFLESREDSVGACNAELEAAIKLYSDMQGDSDSHDVTVHTTDFDDCYLKQFSVLSKPLAFDDATGGGLKQSVRFVWRQLVTS